MINFRFKNLSKECNKKKDKIFNFKKKQNFFKSIKKKKVNSIKFWANRRKIAISI